MIKSKTIKKQKNSDNETVYLTIKTRTGFECEIIKCVVLVKTSKKIIYQSPTVIYKSKEYIQARKQAELFFEDSVLLENSKLVQLRLF